MTTVPTPPDSEQTRQYLVHHLRTSRMARSRELVKSNFTDKKAASQLVEINAKIEILQYLGDPAGSIPEPSIEEVEERGHNWYWEPWQNSDEDDDSEVG